MKRFFMILMIAIAIMPAIKAQFTKIGGGIAVATGVAWNNEDDSKSHRIGIPAITLKGIYEISVPLHIEPSFSWFMPRVTKTTFTAGDYQKQIVSCIMFDVNGHYVFNSLDRFEFYGLTGLNIAFLGNKWVSMSDGTKYKSKESDNAFGLNLGAGAYFKLTEQFDIYGEAKYVLNKYKNHIMVNAGVLINLDWLIKHENDTM
jgi:opacity protein-like surface antigen